MSKWRNSQILLFFSSLGGFCAMMSWKFPGIYSYPDLYQQYPSYTLPIILVTCALIDFTCIVKSIKQEKRNTLYFLSILLMVLQGLLFFVRPSGMDFSNHFYLSMDWVVMDLLMMAAIFIPLEKWFSKQKQLQIYYPQIRLDMVYYLISHLFVQLFNGIAVYPSAAIFHHQSILQISSYPMLLQLFVALFVTDLGQYFAHRFLHSFEFTWRFHAVHHSMKTMNWFAISRTHPLDIIFVRTISYMPVYLLGLSSSAFTAFVLFMAIHQVFIHANIRLHFGFLNYLIVTPQYHHWHHCKDRKFSNKNFAIHFPIIDWIFGTYYLPNKEWPKENGIDESDFPETYIGQLFFPFRLKK